MAPNDVTGGLINTLRLFEPILGLSDVPVKYI